MTDKEGLNVLTHEQAFPLHDAEFKRINSRIKDLEDLGEKSIEIVSKMEKSIEFIHSRLDQRETQTDAIIKLGASVEHMVTEVKELSVQVKEVVKQMSDHEHRISDFEKSTIKDDIKAIDDKVGTVMKTVIELQNAPAKKIAQMVEHGFKAVIVVLFLGMLYLISDGRLGG